MRALLVRHASAGDRSAWTEDDRLRPLDAKGRRQAEALAATLAELGATRLLSSPYVRCVQTLDPAAERLGLQIETRLELAEGATRDEALTLLAGGGVPALCTHGDVLWELLPGRKAKKGSIWVIEADGGELRAERYLPPA